MGVNSKINMSQAILNEVKSYSWSIRKNFYLGEKSVPGCERQLLLVCTISNKSKVKRHGRDYHYNPEWLTFELIKCLQLI